MVYVDQDKDLPRDWEKPDWGKVIAIHNWRNYVSDEVKAEWGNFSDYQKKILAISYKLIADGEDWD